MDEIATLDREAEKVVKELGIPPCPAILTGFLREMRDDDPDLTKIGKLISGDVSLAAAMLKTVNSAFYGLDNKATTVHQALALLGLRTVGNLVTGLLLRQAFSVSSGSFVEQFWETSSRVSAIAAQLAAELRIIAKDIAYTFGLFRDCGMPLMMAKFPNYKTVFSSAVPELGRPITATENQHFLVNHARVGYELAKSWGLGDDVCNAILWHHDYAMVQKDDESISSNTRRLISLALLAEQIYWRSENDKDCLEWAVAGPIALERLKISEERFKELADEIEASPARR